MNIDIEFIALDEILKNLQGLATGRELEEVTTKIIKQETEKAKKEIASKFPKSKDNSKSGKRGDRPNGHFVDNIPTTSIKKKGDYYYIVIGEQKEDGKYFYIRFPEWGTSKQKPHLIFTKTRETIQDDLNKIGIEEYGKLLQKKLDGR